MGHAHGVSSNTRARFNASGHPEAVFNSSRGREKLVKQDETEKHRVLTQMDIDRVQERRSWRALVGYCVARASRNRPIDDGQ